MSTIWLVQDAAATVADETARARGAAGSDWILLRAESEKEALAGAIAYDALVIDTLFIDGGPVWAPEDGPLDAVELVVKAQARESAADHRAQGWSESPAAYDLGNFHGDVDALDTRLARVSTRDERFALERAIRAELGGAS